jgi:hypothetical protein
MCKRGMFVTGRRFRVQVDDLVALALEGGADAAAVKAVKDRSLR